MSSNLMEQSTYLSQITAKIFVAWETKALSGFSLAVLSFFFDTLQKDALIALLSLIIFDFFSAVLAAYKSGEPIRSSRVFHTALKITVYFSLVSAGFMAEKAIAIGIIDEVLLGFLVVTELISIIENTGKAGYAIPTGLLNTLKDFKSKR